MKVECLFVGKTTEKYIEEGMKIYLKRLQHYLPFSTTVIPSSVISTNKEAAIKKESETILNKISGKDYVVLLDERGKEMTSVQLSEFMNKSLTRVSSKLIFIVGGAYGVSQQIFDRANLVVSFSKFTLTHQMIRLFLVEQVYRAMTIIRNESYHHS